MWIPPMAKLKPILMSPIIKTVVERRREVWPTLDGKATELAPLEGHGQLQESRAAQAAY